MLSFASFFSREDGRESIQEIALDELSPDPNEVLANESNPLKASKLAVNLVGARVYELSGFKKNKLNFFVIGCHGNGGKSQKKTAKLLNKIAAENRPDFILFLGDNVYDYGAASPDDKLFETCFQKIYFKPKLTALHGIPCFVILGNHDGNYHKKRYLSSNPPGKKTEINEVAYNYLPDGVKFKTVSELQLFFSQRKLPLQNLQNWNMPYYFYSLIAGDTQIFCINSNSYAKDYYDLITGAESNEINQAKWFAEEAHKAQQAGRRILVALHHPPFTAGKRSFAHSYDTNQYLSEDQIQTLGKHLDATSRSYNELIALIMAQQNIKPKIFFGAHDHAMGFVNFAQADSNFDFCQVLSGGGGGDLQSQMSFAGQPYIGCYLKNNGFVQVTADFKNPEKYDLIYRTTADHYLEFNNLSQNALRHPQDDNIELLREEVIEVCNGYFASLDSVKPSEESIYFKTNRAINPSENKSSLGEYVNYFVSSFSANLNSLKDHFFYNSPNDIDHIQNILAYLNQPNLPIYEKVVFKLRQILAQISDRNLVKKLGSKLDVPSYNYSRETRMQPSMR